MQREAELNALQHLQDQFNDGSSSHRTSNMTSTIRTNNQSFIDQIEKGESMH